MCAVVGVYNSPNASKIAYYSLFAMQHRGQEATGISSSDSTKIYTIKDRGLVTKVFDEEILNNVLIGDMAIGHNRYSTAGKDSILDAQPIFARYKLGEISIVHNGNLINKNEIREKLIEEGAIFQTSMDTENIIHLISRQKDTKLENRIINAIKEIKGAYSLIILSRSKMFVIRDKYGIRPLSIGKLPDGGYIVASETCAFDLVGAKFIRDVKAGEMLIFRKDEKGFKSKILFDDIDYRPCAFEYIYFARPDSVIDGKNVYQIRKEMGRALAKEANIQADIVIPVPDSGIAASLGYAQESGIPFEMAIVRNHYVGRTFIEPTQEIRSSQVKLKLSPIKAKLTNKRVIVIDDSLVRGTTSKQIIKMIRNAGAKEVHMVIAAPEIKFPCYYGIDTPTKEELISSSNTPDEIRDLIGANSLRFLSIDSLVKAIGSDRRYSIVSFDGDYFIK